MTTLPNPPVQSDRAKARVPLRFEDVTQDGRLVLESLPNAIGPTVWRRMLTADPFARSCKEKGIVPILSRFVLEGTAGPFSVGADVEAETTYQIALTGTGRLVLDVWADLFGPVGRTYGTPPDAKTPILAGRVFAEHVFTRPFAAPGERRVSASDFDGVLDVQAHRPPSPRGEAIAALPEGAVALDPGFVIDPDPITFGLMHTDSNAHVNSLVYLRMCEESALRGFVALGRGSAWLGREIDIAYRKPCFAGQTVRIFRQTFEHAGRLGVAAVIAGSAGDANDAAPVAGGAHAYARMMFEP